MQSTTHYSDHLKVLVSDRNDDMQMHHLIEITQIGDALHKFDTNFIAAEFSSNTKRVKKECSSNIVQQSTYPIGLQSMVYWEGQSQSVKDPSRGKYPSIHPLSLGCFGLDYKSLSLRASGTV